MAAVKTVPLILCAALIVACAANPEPEKREQRGSAIACTDPRPKICHKALRPVCATRDNGVRCVTTPCDSTEEATYPNECLACADADVYSYRIGTCKA